MNWRIFLALAAAALALCPFLGSVSRRIDVYSSFLPLAIPLALFSVAPLRRFPGVAPIIASAAALLLSGAIIAPEWNARPSSSVGQGMQRLVIVTHNVAVANVDPQSTVESLAASDADILLLQETNGKLAPYLSQLDVRFPYRNRCEHRCSLAILSRFPLEPVRYRFRDGRGEQTGPGLLRTRVILPDGSRVPLVTLHLPWPTPPERQAQTRAALASVLEDQDRTQMIVSGDFNLTPWSAAMKTLDGKLQPLRRATRALPTYPSRFDGRAFPLPLLPIDHIFAGPEWSIISVKRLARTGSDHYPVRMEMIKNRAQARQGRMTQSRTPAWSSIDDG